MFPTIGLLALNHASTDCTIV